MSEPHANSEGNVWVDDIPVAELRVGDHVNAWFNCVKGAQHGRIPRRGEVVEILGNIIRVNTRWRKAPMSTTRSDIVKAWGYRKPAPPCEDAGRNSTVNVGL